LRAFLKEEVEQECRRDCGKGFQSSLKSLDDRMGLSEGKNQRMIEVYEQEHTD